METIAILIEAITKIEKSKFEKAVTYYNYKGMCYICELHFKGLSHYYILSDNGTITRHSYLED